MSAPIVGFESWMRAMERRMSTQERRVQISTASDLMGPGVGPNATEISDWNNEVIAFNGFYFSAPGSINSPDPAEAWMGFSIADPDGVGYQRVTIYRDPQSEGMTNLYPAWPGVTMVRAFWITDGSTRSYSEWASEHPSWYKVCGSNLALTTTTLLQVPNLAQDLQVRSPLEVYRVYSTLDLLHNDTGPQAVNGVLEVDAVNQGPIIKFNANAINNFRFTSSQSWRVTGLTPGTRTIRMLAGLTAAGAYTVNADNSTMSVERLT